jgi:hypothetical protein
MGIIEFSIKLKNTTPKLDFGPKLGEIFKKPTKKKGIHTLSLHVRLYAD